MELAAGTAVLGEGAGAGAAPAGRGQPGPGAARTGQEVGYSGFV